MVSLACLCKYNYGWPGIYSSWNNVLESSQLFPRKLVPMVVRLENSWNPHPLKHHNSDFSMVGSGSKIAYIFMLLIMRVNRCSENLLLWVHQNIKGALLLKKIKIPSHFQNEKIDRGFSVTLGHVFDVYNWKKTWYWVF